MCVFCVVHIMYALVRFSLCYKSTFFVATIANARASAQSSTKYSLHEVQSKIQLDIQINGGKTKSKTKHTAQKMSKQHDVYATRFSLSLWMVINDLGEQNAVDVDDDVVDDDGDKSDSCAFDANVAAF